MQTDRFIDMKKLHPRLGEAVVAMRADGMDELAIAHLLRDVKKALDYRELSRARAWSPEKRKKAALRMAERVRSPEFKEKRDAGIARRMARVREAMALLEAKEKADFDNTLRNPAIAEAA